MRKPSTRATRSTVLNAWVLPVCWVNGTSDCLSGTATEMSGGGGAMNLFSGLQPASDTSRKATIRPAAARPAIQSRSPKHRRAIAHPAAERHSGGRPRHEQTDGRESIDETADMGGPGDRLAAGAGRAAED